MAQSYDDPVGQRSQTETLAAVYQAFLQRRTWKQVELARTVGVSTEALRRVLTELSATGMPLEREEERRQEVYWSVPKDWFPGSVLFKSAEIPELLRQLRRVPAGEGRKRILDLVLSRLPTRDAGGTAVVVAREASAQEEQYLSTVEDSANRRVALSMRYYTASRGVVGDRHASVHRVLVGPPARFIATCHRSGGLRTFRVDGIMNARLDDHERYRGADDADVERYHKDSLDGFHGEGGSPTSFSFLVRNPEARWVKNNLLEGMTVEDGGDGVRVHVSTTALGRLARFVVSLGGAATPETPALAKEVAELARGALSSAGPAAD
jgi:proteasome accessory factor C